MTLWLYVSKNHSSIQISQNNATKFTQKYYAVILTFIHCFSSNSQRSGNPTESCAIGQHFQVSSCQLLMIDVINTTMRTGLDFKSVQFNQNLNQNVRTFEI
jgi:hypothetical protein